MSTLASEVKTADWSLSVCVRFEACVVVDGFKGLIHKTTIKKILKALVEFHEHKEINF